MADAGSFDLDGEPADPLAVLTSERGVWDVRARPRSVRTLSTGDGAGVLDALAGMVRAAGGSVGASVSGGGASTGGGWVVALGYELGRDVEPAARVHARRVDGAWPWDAVLWRCDGREASVPSVGGAGRGFRLGAWSGGGLGGGSGGAWYERAVARGVEFVHAGDVFQVNLAHRLRAPFEGSTRALARALFRAARPVMGAYLEIEEHGRRHAAISVSPELFLTYDARTRRVETRPIKGTRPLGVGEEGARALASSAKDAAELAMIVDLMRNDLGRVCAFGSVQVVEPRVIERHEHAGVVHGVATIEGRLRDGLDAVDLLRAAFPCGSITGAPKVRAMQIIEELEPEARGLYTGAIGWIGDDGSMTLSVAIRTAVVVGDAGPGGADDVRRGELIYGVGAGIVAESDPRREWEETMDKARVMRSVMQTPPGARAGQGASESAA